ncbi:redox-regulated ATPase YchF [Buchnera aphidicola]|uniref:redox-regulated ATPase YchF n=1 Tax=Buchnera aphidicola TaxID=9 RepID=UPI003BEEC20C
MSFKCGIIGLPNVGKSTLFNALTKGNAVIANFPFCTIKPNIGIVPVLDKRVDNLVKIVNPKKVVHAYIEFVDIAGLVSGASKGEGLGNQFLSNIRDTNAIIHVVRCFQDNDIVHIHNKVTPLNDIDVINTELILSDLDTCEKYISQLKKKYKVNNKDIQNTLLVLKKCINHLNNGLMIRNLSLNKEEKEKIIFLRLLTIKPTIYVANINEEKNSFVLLNELKKIAKEDNTMVIPIFANLELDLSTMNNDEKKYFMKELNISHVGLNDIIMAGYQLLNLITFFTVGPKEIHAWSIPKGSTSVQAAEKIHSDFKKGFIRAQIISYIDFIKYKNELKIRELGKCRTEGKNYFVQDGDIIHFLFNV